MSKPVRLIPAAQEELRKATAWYQERNREVASEFLTETRRVLAMIQEFPATGSYVPEVEDASIRRMPIHRFPYHIVFVELQNEIEVLAVAHDRRRPAYWLSRRG